MNVGIWPLSSLFPMAHFSALAMIAYRRLALAPYLAPDEGGDRRGTTFGQVASMVIIGTHDSADGLDS